MSLVNDFNGLGIVMEEKEPGLRESLKLIHDDEFVKDISNETICSEAGSEMLLPPLPVEDELSIIAPTASACVSTADLKPVSGYTSPFVPMDKTFEPINDELKIASDYSEILLNSCLSSTEINSPSLNLENALHVLPALTSPKTSKPEAGAAQNSDNSTSQPQQPNTLPLKRLKSLKMGIRKLSLSNLASNNSSSNVNSPSTVVPVPLLSSTSNSYPTLCTSTSSTTFTISGTSKPVLSPTDTLPLRHSQDSRNSEHLNCDHMMINFEKQSAPSAASSTASGGFSSGFSKRNRSRTLSGPALPATPNYSSPVIILSDNLHNSKKSLMNIEHSYFDNLHYAKSTSRSSVSNGSSRNEYSSGSGEELKEDDASRSISDISNPSELLSYLNFLKEQKKTVVNAFETTRKKLTESGWCSEHDLNNLQLQQDSSLCQLETKILFIKERLDSEFNLSLFNGKNDSPNKIGERKTSLSVEHEKLLSPSLRTLENRCFTFSES